MFWHFEIQPQNRPFLSISLHFVCVLSRFVHQPKFCTRARSRSKQNNRPLVLVREEVFCSFHQSIKWKIFSCCSRVSICKIHTSSYLFLENRAMLPCNRRLICRRGPETQLKDFLGSMKKIRLSF